MRSSRSFKQSFPFKLGIYPVGFVMIIELLLMNGLIIGSLASSSDKSPGVTISASDNNNEHQRRQIKDTSKNLWEMVASMGSTGSNGFDDLLVRERGKIGGNGGSAHDRSYTIERSYHHKMSTTSSQSYDFGVTLDQTNRFELDWTYDYNENQINFALILNGTQPNGHKVGSDVFALGFSDRGQLETSDFCLIWYDLAQRLHLQDAKLNQNKELELIDESLSYCRLLRNGNSHKIAANQRVVATSAEVENAQKLGYIRIQFSRPLDTCEEKLDYRQHDSNNQHLQQQPYYTIDNGTTHLIWFNIRGPLLSLDGINLGALEQPTSARARVPGLPTGIATPSLDHSHHHNNKQPLQDSGRFEWGMKRVQLIANKPEVLDVSRSEHQPQLQPQDQHNNHHHDIHMNAFPVPDVETTYWCKLFKLPEKFERRRHHITRYAPLITIGNKHVVHHMELFNCANLSPKQEAELRSLYEREGGWSGDCNSMQRPPITEACKRVILAWAMGAKPFEYPPQVGQSIGGTGYSPFVMLEIHYNNVQRAAGLIDFSGLRFEYTNLLRPFDAGILEVGLEYSPKNSIPPGLIVPLAGHCVSECTRLAFSESTSGADGAASDHSPFASNSNNRHHYNRHYHHTSVDGFNLNQQQFLPNLSSDLPSSRSSIVLRNLEQLKGGGIFVFGAQMHTHLTGVASWTEHIREGELIGELQRDNHYSPHFQEIRLLPEIRYIAPGDALIHYCLYDTRLRSNITLGGYSTQEEMCVTYLHYYPRTDLEVCKSSVDSKALEQYFAYLAREESQKTTELLAELHIADDVTPASVAASINQLPPLVILEDNIRSNLNPSSNSYDIRNNQTTRISSNRNLLPEKPNCQQDQQRNKNHQLKSIGENYNSIEWSNKRSLELLQFYSNAPLSVQCNRSDGSRFAGFWNGIQPARLRNDFSQSSSSSSPELFNLRQQSGRELASYRGHGFRKRHARCEAPAQTIQLTRSALGDAGCNSNIAPSDLPPAAAKTSNFSDQPIHQQS